MCNTHKATTPTKPLLYDMDQKKHSVNKYMADVLSAELDWRSDYGKTISTSKGVKMFRKTSTDGMWTDPEHPGQPSLVVESPTWPMKGRSRCSNKREVAMAIERFNDPNFAMYIILIEQETNKYGKSVIKSWASHVQRVTKIWTDSNGDVRVTTSNCGGLSARPDRRVNKI